MENLRDIEHDAGSIACRDATTGELLGRVPRMSAEDVRIAEAEATAGGASWRGTSRRQRRRVFATLLDEIVTAQDELCRLAVHESGKTMIQALLGDVLPTCAALHALVRSGDAPTRSLGPTSGERRGLVAVRASPHFPLHGIVAPVVSALAEGDAVLLMLSEHASWSGGMYVEILRNVLRHHGHDPRIVQGLTGDDDTASTLREMGVDRVVGSWPDDAGHGPARQTAMIVCEDADVDGAVRAAMLTAFTPLPPPFVPAARILVHTRVHDVFVSAAARRIRAMRHGPPLDETVDCGVIAPWIGVDHVAALVDDASRHGAKMLVGGQLDHAFERGHYPPTLVVDVPPHARIARESTFGPVMAVTRFDDDAQATELVGDATAGARVSIFSRDRRRTEALCRRLRATDVAFNDIGLMDALRAGPRHRYPTKVVLPAVSPYPAGPHTYAVIESLLRLRFGPGVRQRLRAATELGRSMRSLWTL